MKKGGFFINEKNLETYADFLAGIAAGEKMCLGGNERPDMLIVREKWMPKEAYLKFFSEILQKKHVQGSGQTQIIPHTHPAAAEQAGSRRLHLPLPLFQKYREYGMLSGWKVGTSIHSVEEAELAQELGAAYVTAGHIFTTDCKKGAEPRGLAFLESVCGAVDIPVYAIGGIHKEQLPLIWGSRALGACMMSEYMRG